MTATSILLIVLIVLVSVLFVFSLKILSYVKSKNGMQVSIESKIETEAERLRNSFQTEFSNNRTELKQDVTNSFVSFGNIFSSSLKDINESQKNQLESFSNNLNNLTKSNDEKLTSLITLLENQLKEINDTSVTNGKENRKELKDSLEIFKKDFSQTIEDFSKTQRDNFFELLRKQNEQNVATSTKLDQMRDTVEKKISELQKGNEAKLDEMRATVDEKLQKTLETRLGESFKLVSERLEAVHKGLGDMQQLATGVGDLKKVLSNVKTRGVLGEYQLENILEQLLTVEQYSKNVKTKSGSEALVEFAIKLPGRDDNGKIVWLPIDSKFPKEDFELLLEAYDHSDANRVEEIRKNFIRGLKKCAQDICTKYIDPPNTTDFAVLFLPFESLYAEVLRVPGLFEAIQRECRIIITGPTTLSALLNSLQMGFRTLAIEKRSSEVWQLLATVKVDFGKFGDVLEKTQKKLAEASNVIEQAGVRSRSIERKLRKVQELPETERVLLISPDSVNNANSSSPEISGNIEPYQ